MRALAPQAALRRRRLLVRQKAGNPASATVGWLVLTRARPRLVITDAWPVDRPKARRVLVRRWRAVRMRSADRLHAWLVPKRDVDLVRPRWLRRPSTSRST
jgi:hypothetical protein